jgi:hypothetical protein
MTVSQLSPESLPSPLAGWGRLGNQRQGGCITRCVRLAQYAARLQGPPSTLPVTSHLCFTLSPPTRCAVTVTSGATGAQRGEASVPPAAWRARMAAVRRFAREGAAGRAGLLLSLRVCRRHVLHRCAAAPLLPVPVNRGNSARALIKQRKWGSWLTRTVQSPFRVGVFFSSAHRSLMRWAQRSIGVAERWCGGRLTPIRLCGAAGHMADSMDLRVYLTLGSAASGVLACMYSLLYFLRIHHVAAYYALMLAMGLAQSTGCTHTHCRCLPRTHECLAHASAPQIWQPCRMRAA